MSTIAATPENKVSDNFISDWVVFPVLAVALVGTPVLIGYGIAFLWGLF